MLRYFDQCIFARYIVGPIILTSIDTKLTNIENMQKLYVLFDVM